MPDWMKTKIACITCVYKFCTLFLSNKVGPCIQMVKKPGTILVYA